MRPIGGSREDMSQPTTAAVSKTSDQHRVSGSPKVESPELSPRDGSSSSNNNDRRVGDASSTPRLTVTDRKARKSHSETTSKRGSFSLQSGSHQYGLVPLNQSYANNSPSASSTRSNSVTTPDFYTFPRRKLDSNLPTPIIMKTNGQLNGGNLTATVMTSRDHNSSAVSSPSVDSMYSSPALSPRHSAFNTSLNGRDVDGASSVCSGGSDTDSMTCGERFYINEHVSLTPASSTHTISELGEDDEHPFFTGSKDIRRPDTLQEMKIVSNKGTIRGVKNRVKGAIATFLQQNDGKPVKNYRVLEKDKIVMYTTSMMVVRETHDHCKTVRTILQTHMLEYEERDIFMSRDNQRELQERLGADVDVPQVFVDGQHMGGKDEIQAMNESGELRRIFRNFKKRSHQGACERCGGYRYIPCLSCHGSRKSGHRNHFTEEFCALRCTICDENGLVRCDACNTDTAADTPQSAAQTKL